VAYNDPLPEVTPEERERNLNKSMAEDWADADESLMDKALETSRKLAQERREQEDGGANPAPSPSSSSAAS
jgi:hypothetical protein